jgi:hypothetical protein
VRELRRGEYSSSRMGFWALPFSSALAVSRRKAEDSARSGRGGECFRLDVVKVSWCADPPTDGEVRLRPAMPPVLDAVLFDTALEI